MERHRKERSRTPKLENKDGEKGTRDRNVTEDEVEKKDAKEWEERRGEKK